MKATKMMYTLLLAVISLYSLAQNTQNPELKQQIDQILLNKKADVGVSIIGSGKNDNIQINGNKMYPMLSAVKFPIALAVLDKVQKGELAMNQHLFIKKEELLDNPENWSPFKEKFPEGNVTITLEEALSWMVSYSDNNLTDILLRLIGGPETVQRYINSKYFSIKNDEEDMHKDWESQFINRITPNEAVALLKKLDDGKLLNKTYTTWLYTAMLNNQSGAKRLKAQLPKGVKIAHRTGTSFTNAEGMTGAINDYGIIELPNNQKIYIAVFVHNTYESFPDSEKIIADISKAAFDYYMQKSK
ncbi:class A beta-lactamase [Empedobacter brevis]|uniref:class A beta-lactamase n=1 Tax=Empedobacter brevis TaxID=247 RepID=UPI00123CB0AD|nr:class A beta-lactamase [Empedobacter brevis]QES93608.1 class A beta-lactamase [Empedobacter brevis]